MDDAASPLIESPISDAATRSLVEDIKDLASDGRTLLEAELAYQKSRAVVAGAGAKGVAGWAAFALALAFFALMALVMGVLLGLSEAIGAWAATGIVFAGLLLAAGLSGLAASRRWKRMSAALSDSGEDPAP